MRSATSTSSAAAAARTRRSASAADWSGWAGVDALIRVLNGDKVEPAGIGLQVIDADNNMPAEGQPFAYNPVVDFASAYQKLWNAS